MYIGIFGPSQQENGAKSGSGAPTGAFFFHFVMYISGDQFEEHCCNISKNKYLAKTVRSW